ncbi:MAG: response regulator transcription factor [Ktedonobacteraceae bacterium]
MQENSLPSPDAVEQVFNQEPGHASSPSFDLTKRELEILSLVVKGLSNAQIAKQLNLSYSTVSTHLSSIYSKLKVSSRVQALRRALEHRLV